MRWTGLTGGAAIFLAAEVGAGTGAGRSVTDDLLARLPATLTMPAEVTEAMRWLENGGAVLPWGDARAIGLYPGGAPDIGGSLVHFIAPEDYQFDYAQLPPDQVRARFFPFVRTGGDGSWAGLWLDDQGQQHFVHVGSGSGSVWFGIMTDDPVDFLRFLAIGYDEPAFYDGSALTPLQFWLDAEGYDLADQAELEEEAAWEPPVPPSAFADFLAERFGRRVPDHGAGLLRSAPDDSDEFSRWLSQISG